MRLIILQKLFRLKLTIDCVDFKSYVELGSRIKELIIPYDVKNLWLDDKACENINLR